MQPGPSGTSPGPWKPAKPAHTFGTTELPATACQVLDLCRSGLEQPADHASPVGEARTAVDPRTLQVRPA